MLATVRYLVTFGSYGEGARAIASLFNLSMSFGRLHPVFFREFWKGITNAIFERCLMILGYWEGTLRLDNSSLNPVIEKLSPATEPIGIYICGVFNFSVVYVLQKDDGG